MGEAEIKIFQKVTPKPPSQLSGLLHLDQIWKLFASLSDRNMWIVLPAKLKDGTIVDIMTNGKPVDYEKPAYRYNRLFVNAHMSKLVGYLMRPPRDDYDIQKKNNL